MDITFKEKIFQIFFIFVLHSSYIENRGRIKVNFKYITYEIFSKNRDFILAKIYYKTIPTYITQNPTGLFNVGGSFCFNLKFPTKFGFFGKKKEKSKKCIQMTWVYISKIKAHQFLVYEI